MSRQQAGRPDAGAPQPLRYMLPAAAGTVWLGLGWVSVTGLAVTVTVMVSLFVAGVPLLAVIALGAAGSALSVVPVAGRPALAWIPTLTSHQLARLTGARSWTRTLEPIATVTSASGRGRLRVGIGPRDLCLVVATTRDTGAAEIAAIAHGRPGRANRRGRPCRVTVVFELVALGRFGVLDPSEQDTELARWGSSLAVLFADPTVRSVEWLTHTRPDTRNNTPATTTAGPGSDGFGRQSGGPAPTEPNAPAAKQVNRAREIQQDYTQLADAITGQATRHRHLLALTIDAPAHTSGADADRGTRRGTGGTGGAGGSATADRPDLTCIARNTASALLASDLLARPLGAVELGTELRLLLDPAFPEMSAVGQFPEAELGSAWLHDQRQWLPMSVRDGWDSCRTDDTHHRCFAVTGWPRQSLPGDWLAPLLHDTPPAGTSRALTVHARPVRPEHAARRARAATAKAHLDANDRSRLGFTPHPGGSAHDGLAEADAAATEGELAAGYRMTDTSALLTISAPDPHQLELACRQLRSLAVAHRLDLRPLHGQHLTALAAALPLGLHAGATS